MRENKHSIEENTVGVIDIYRKMVEEIQDYAIILLDKEGIIRNWNKGAEKIKLYKEDEIIGQHFSIFYLPEDIADNLPQKLITQARQTGRADHEGWRKRKNGSRFWGSITITALHDDNNNVIGYTKVTRDLTEKKIAEDRLRMSEQRYHQMVSEVQDYAIILLNKDGIIENWNAGAEKIKGYSSDEVIGKSFQIFYAKEDRERNLPHKILNEARINGKANHEGWRVRKDGSKFWGLIAVTALHDKDGEVIGFSKVTRDLTDKKLAEDRVAAYLAELEIQNSELEQFAYVASHDLQEPLRKIQTFTELIQENYHDENFVKRYFQKLDLSAKRMSELIKSLLNYSRLTKGVDSDKIEINLDEIVSEVKQDFELLIAEKKATVICDPLPVIMGNRTQIGQLFSNIISNSLKYSKENPVIKIKAQIILREEIADAPKTLNSERYHKISFQDNGIGFDQEYSKLIFSLFQRLHGKNQYSGAGIGLALCKKILENHEGYIEGAGISGEGATFTIYLPEIC